MARPKKRSWYEHRDARMEIYAVVGLALAILGIWFR